MAKHVFRPTEITNLSRKVFIEPPDVEVPEPEEVLTPQDEVLESPSAEEDLEKLQRKAEEFKKSWEKDNRVNHF